MDGRRRYTTSNLCNVLYTYELDRHLGHGAQGITVTAFDPGLMPSSGLSRDCTPAQKKLCAYIPAAASIAQRQLGGGTGERQAALATTPDSTGSPLSTSRAHKPIRPSADSYDTAKARDLWETSAQLIYGSTTR